MSLLVAHSLPPVGDGLAAVLAARLGLTDVRTASDGGELLRMTHERRPRAVLLDVNLDPGNEVALCGALVRLAVPVVVMTHQDSTQHLALLGAGVQGICSAADGIEGVTGALSTVLEGNTYVPPHMLGSILRDLIVARREAVPQTSPVDRLSPRERQVLGLLGTGADHVEIASRLAISPHTAKTHINRLLAKLDVRSRVEAASLAIAQGITPSEDGEAACL